LQRQVLVLVPALKFEVMFGLHLQLPEKEGT
jgi:hypothetical protein